MKFVSQKSIILLVKSIFLAVLFLFNYAQICLHLYIYLLRIYYDYILFNARFSLVLSTAVYNLHPWFLARVLLAIHISFLLEMRFAVPLLFQLKSLLRAVSNLTEHEGSSSPPKNAHDQICNAVVYCHEYAWNDYIQWNAGT